VVRSSLAGLGGGVGSCCPPARFRAFAGSVALTTSGTSSATGCLRRGGRLWRYAVRTMRAMSLPIWGRATGNCAGRANAEAHLGSFVPNILPSTDGIRQIYGLAITGVGAVGAGPD
jgi:hypothetical protein